MLSGMLKMHFLVKPHARSFGGFLFKKKKKLNSHMSRQVLRSWYGHLADILEGKTSLESGFY